MQATIFPHDEGVTVWLSGFEGDPDQTAEVICHTKEDAEALIQDVEKELDVEIPRTWHIQPGPRSTRYHRRSMGA